MLREVDVTHVGTHGIRHRSATDIANFPVKVGMSLTAQKPVAMFMRYIHTEGDPMRQAAGLVGTRRTAGGGGAVAEEPGGDACRIEPVRWVGFLQTGIAASRCYWTRSGP